jgi:penicillin-binding protein 1C
MHDVSGVSGAAPVWREVMDWLHRGDANTARPVQQSNPPAAPPGVVRSRIRFDPPSEPSRDEWFVHGSEMTVVRASSTESLAHISYPAEGSIIALDPDIPPQRQRVPLRLSAMASKGWVWRMDQKVIGKATAPLMWLPQPGRHRLSLESGLGETLSSVSFEVRAIRSSRH